MKNRLLPSLGLIALFVAACTPRPAQTQPPPDPVTIGSSATPFLPPPPFTQAPTQEPVATQPATEGPIPVATSRGPDLHATDPTRVSLASGQYQFVEFFRFT